MKLTCRFCNQLRMQVFSQQIPTHTHTFVSKCHHINFIVPHHLDEVKRERGGGQNKLCTAGREKNITFSRWWIFPISRRQVHKLVQLGAESGNEGPWTVGEPEPWWLILLSGKLNQIVSLKQSACAPHIPLNAHMHTHTRTQINK